MVARKLLSVVALAAVLATGCTSENNPVSPTGSIEDTTPPAVPQDVSTERERGLWTMSWSANAEAIWPAKQRTATIRSSRRVCMRR
jgi:PBP1b-binding outer membrane lipoprotein LpoB